MKDIKINFYAIARSLLAFSTLITLLLTKKDVLFRPLGDSNFDLFKGYFLMKFNFFNLFGLENLLLGKIIACLILGLVISGWRPKLTGVLHWWVSLSFCSSCLVVDGGDQINANLCLLLIPFTLFDYRINHWSGPNFNVGNKYVCFFLASVFFLIQLQVSVIYFQAATSKFSVVEWANGTALYYWLKDPIYGSPKWMSFLVDPILKNDLLIIFATWGVLVFEVLLSASILFKNGTRKYFLIMGVLFHFGIALIHGLGSFFITMSAALFLFTFNFQSLISEDKENLA